MATVGTNDAVAAAAVVGAGADAATAIAGRCY